jgi:excisionase family DNA binding protein
MQERNERENGDRLLLLTEVAQITRAPVSTVRFWVATGKLQSIRPGRRRLVRSSDLACFLAPSGGKKP